MKLVIVLVCISLLKNFVVSEEPGVKLIIDVERTRHFLHDMVMSAFNDAFVDNNGKLALEYENVRIYNIKLLSYENLMPLLETQSPNIATLSMSDGSMDMTAEIGANIEGLGGVNFGTELAVEGFNFDATFNILRDEDERLKLTTGECSSSTQNMEFKFNYTGPDEDVINPMLEEYFNGDEETETSLACQYVIQQAEKYFQLVKDFYPVHVYTGFDMILDLGLVEDPEVTSSSITLPARGLWFSPEADFDKLPENSQPLPDFSESAKDFKLIAGEFTFQSYLTAMWENGYFWIGLGPEETNKLVETPVTAEDYVKDQPDLLKYSERPVYFDASSAHPPTVEITDESLIIRATSVVELYAVHEDNSTTKIGSVSLDITDESILEFKDGKIVGKVIDSSVKVTSPDGLPTEKIERFTQYFFPKAIGKAMLDIAYGHGRTLISSLGYVGTKDFEIDFKQGGMQVSFNLVQVERQPTPGEEEVEEILESLRLPKEGLDLEFGEI